MEELVKGALNNLDEMKEAAAIDYGHPQGDEEARVLMADAMTAWYKKTLSLSIFYLRLGVQAVYALFLKHCMSVIKISPYIE